MNKAWPSFPVYVKSEIQNNPSLNVQYRGYQFSKFVDVDGSYSGEFSSSGHGPFNSFTRQFLNIGKFSVNESLDFCASHYRIDNNCCFCYFVQIPAWLAVDVDSGTKVYFRFTYDLTVHDSDTARTRFILYHRFAFIDGELSGQQHDVFDSNTCVTFIIDHNLLTDRWTLSSSVLTGFARFALD